MSVEEQQLLARARAGELDAFADFVRQFERRIRTVLHRLLDDDRDVDEALQDTFLQAWKSLDRFRGDAAPFTWLYRIAVNEALQRRRRKRLPTVELQEADAPDLNSGSETSELRGFLVEALRALPPDYRDALVLRDVEGFSNEEVAAILGLSVPAAKSRIHRARMQVRERLERWETE